VFFSHNKSDNSNFSHDFLEQRTALPQIIASANGGLLKGVAAYKVVLCLFNLISD